jgi:hypothetical protein
MIDAQNNLPDPEVVMRAAAEAAAPRVLEDYIDAISILRDKKFTFREIAEWLKKNFDIQADHNSVWRAYTKYMDDYTAHLEAEADDELERNEAIAEAEQNGAARSLGAAPIPGSERAAETPAKDKPSKATAKKAKRKKK